MVEATYDTARRHPLAGSVFAATGAAITLAPEAWRCSLRAGPDMVEVLGKALGIALPTGPKTSTTEGTRTALWLGPDEWLIIDTKADPCRALDTVEGLFSAVDISHRNTAVLISGPSAADILNAGCPQNLSLETFPVGACSRTIFGKVEVVLHRVKPTVFRMEVWQSFSRYAFDLLEDAARSI